MFEKNFGIQAVHIDDSKDGARSRFQDEVTLASNHNRPLPYGIHDPARVQCENDYVRQYPGAKVWDDVGEGAFGVLMPKRYGGRVHEDWVKGCPDGASLLNAPDPEPSLSRNVQYDWRRW